MSAQERKTEEREMATARSPRRTRARTPANTETDMLRAANDELAQLREERLLHQQREAELRRLLQEREEALELRRTNNTHPLQNFNNAEPVAVTNPPEIDLGYRLKPDTFDGNFPLREFISQFDLIAQANK